MSGKAKEAGIGAEIVVLLVIVFIDMVGFGIVIPFLPFWAEAFGATEDLVAMLMTVYAACQFLFAFPLGWFSDRVGRKPVLILSILGSVGSFVLLGFAETLFVIFLARALGGVTGANISVAQAYIADITSKEERARGMGLLGAALGLGFILGPAIGGLLAGPDPADPNFRLTFFVAAGISMAATLLALVFLREPTRHAERLAEKGGPLDRLRNFGLLLGHPGIAFPIATAFIIGFAMAGLEATFALWTNRAHGWGPAANGWFFAFIGVILVIVQGGLVGPLSRRFGEATVLSAGVLVLAAGMLAVTQSVNAPLVFLSGGLVGLGFALSNPALNAITSSNAPPDRQGAVMGVLQSTQSLARIFGPAGAGLLFRFLGRDAPYYTGAAILALAFVMALMLIGRQRRLAEAHDQEP